MAQNSDLALAQSAPSPLEIPELLEMILDKLSHKDIPSAARVCRTWCHPSLDRIWHYMDSLVPLFSLVRPMVKASYGKWVFANDLQDADWSRYAVYAPRIRELVDSNLGRHARLSIVAIRSILAHLPSDLQLLCPATIKFHRTYKSSPASSLLQLPLISQSLRMLVLFSARSLSDEASLGLASALWDASRLPQPCLENVEAWYPSPNEPLVEALSACLIKHRSRISRLSIRTPFNEQLWGYVISLPALQDLDIALLEHDGRGRLEEVMPMIRALVAGQSQLKGLQLGLPPHGEPSQSYSSSFGIIRDLMGLQNLETLKLRTSLPLSLTESQVKEMGVSWPNMRILELDTASTYYARIQRADRASQNSLSLLPCLLRSLPRLKQLRVPFTCDEPLAAPQEECGGSALRTLDLKLCPPPSSNARPEQVVAYLAAVLPHTAQIGSLYSSGSPGPFWSKVAEGLSDLREAAKP